MRVFESFNLTRIESGASSSYIWGRFSLFKGRSHHLFILPFHTQRPSTLVPERFHIIKRTSSSFAQSCKKVWYRSLFVSTFVFGILIGNSLQPEDKAKEKKPLIDPSSKVNVEPNLSINELVEVSKKLPVLPDLNDPDMFIQLKKLAHMLGIQFHGESLDLLEEELRKIILNSSHPQKITEMEKIADEQGLPLAYLILKEQLKTNIDVYREVCFSTAFAGCKAGKWEQIDAIKNYLPRLRDRRGLTLFLKLVKQGDEKNVALFLKQFNDDGRTCIYATQKNTGSNAFHIAAEAGHIDLIPYLTDLFTVDDKNLNGLSPAELSIAHGKSKFLRAITYLLDETFLNSLILASISKGQIECLEVLINSKKNTARSLLKNIRNGGNTILHQAISANTKGDQKYKMIEHLISFRHEETKELLKTPDYNGKHPLHLAIDQKDARLIGLLVRYGADINDKDGCGNTCLHHAALNNLSDIIPFLFSLGAKADIVNSNGKRAIDLVGEDQSSSIVKECRAKLLNGAAKAALKTRSPPNFKEEPPEILTLKGGGAAGLAYIGVLEGLEKQDDFLKNLKIVAGTSAGSIMAAFISSGHSSKEIKRLFIERDLSSFLNYKSSEVKELVEKRKDANFWNTFKSLFHMYWKDGKAILNPIAQAQQIFHIVSDLPGVADISDLRDWIDVQISNTTGIKNCTFQELSNLRKTDPEGKKFKELYVYAVRTGKEFPVEVEELSAENTPNVVISSAVAASSAIPGLITPQPLLYKDEKSEVYSRGNPTLYRDGGLLLNNPIEKFDAEKYQDKGAWGSRTNRKVLALSLESKGQRTEPDFNKFGLTELVYAFWMMQDIVLAQDPANADRTMRVPVSCGTLDFNLEKEQKETVYNEGFLAQKAFFAEPGCENKT